MELRWCHLSLQHASCQASPQRILHATMHRHLGRASLCFLPLWVRSCADQGCCLLPKLKERSIISRIGWSRVMSHRKNRRIWCIPPFAIILCYLLKQSLQTPSCFKMSSIQPVKVSIDGDSVIDWFPSNPTPSSIPSYSKQSRG